MHGGTKEDHYNMLLDYDTVMLSDYSRVGFNKVDYGFGEPGTCSRSTTTSTSIMPENNY